MIQESRGKMQESMKFNLKEVKSDLLYAISECSQRGLLHTTKWFLPKLIYHCSFMYLYHVLYIYMVFVCYRLAELNYSLKNVKLDTHDLTANISETCQEEDTYTLAKTYFDLKEYDRAAYFTKDCTNPKVRFLHLYSRYLSGEKKKVDDMTDVPPDPMKNDNLKLLCTDLRKDYMASKLDGYGYYLFGVTLKKLQLTKEATDVLVESIHKEPMHWGTWLELAALITDREKLESLYLPEHWMKYFFMAHMYLELQLIDEGLALYCQLQSMGFQKNGYVLAQTAIAVHYRRGELRNLLSGIDNIKFIIFILKKI